MGVTKQAGNKDENRWWHATQQNL